MSTPTAPAWPRLPALAGRPNPCGCCPPIPATLPPSAIIAVGFGRAVLTCDGKVILDGEAAMDVGTELTAADAEALATRDPDHDWRIILDGPLHGETYQRQDGVWVLVAKNNGFA